ncbi:methyltransferase [Microbacterium ulmi]|uniref:Methyltransferase n=1 Tax=Microbacterium ulmi TaxID=179095 RepID=A0A7Y2LZU1_9MICO|nr:methyltransferase [Microbacterium ulmi]NNH03159.1 methyltransferase [Microbacterium ulmi]
MSLESLRRRPDVEGPGLSASDAADRLILDESAAARSAAREGGLVVVGDTHGALTLAAADAGARGIRVHQDALTGERALAANAGMLGLEGSFSSLPLHRALVERAQVVLLRLPRSLEALDDIAALVAAHASPDVVVFAGGRLKHMTHAMNDVLRAHFGGLDVTHARQKSRVLVAREPRAGHDPAPRRVSHDGLVVCAYGGAFAGAAIDIGTRFLLEHLPARVPDGDPLVDFACGTGVVAATLARRHPGHRVYATDQSASAVASALATADANGVADRVTIERADLLERLGDASVSFVALNPPFHSGATLTDAIATRMFADAGRVLRSGGELWTVWNSALLYRPALERLVGPTRQIARNPKFTVTASVRR